MLSKVIDIFAGNKDLVLKLRGLKAKNPSGKIGPELGKLRSEFKVSSIETKISYMLSLIEDKQANSLDVLDVIDRECFRNQCEADVVSTILTLKGQISLAMTMNKIGTSNLFIEGYKWIVEELVRLNEISIAKYLIQNSVIDEYEPEKRIEAIELSLIIKDRETILSMKNDEDPEVREQAQTALNVLNS